MRAAVLSAPCPTHEGPLGLVDRADAAPGPDEVLVEVESCAVCRTDLQLCEGDLGARRLPIVPGHQAVGTVTIVGAEVDGGPDVGDRVGVAWIASTCGRCRFCVDGRENLCDESRFTGWDVDGGVVAINAIHLDRIPAFDYGLLWWERQLRSVANVTRTDVADLVALAAEIPIRTTVEEHPLEDANLALRRLADGELSGAAVLTMT